MTDVAIFRRRRPSLKQAREKTERLEEERRRSKEILHAVEARWEKVDAETHRLYQRRQINGISEGVAEVLQQRRKGRR